MAWLGRRRDAAFWLALGTAFLLVILVANPILRLVLDSVRAPGTGAWTLANYTTAFGRPRNVTAVLNALQLALAVAILAGAMAIPLAWGVSRTDMPGRRFVESGVLASFLIPPFLGAIAWILLAGPNAGFLNRLWVGLTGSAQGPLDIFTFSGLSLVIALYTFPLVFVFVRSALDLISADMEEAAAIHGAGPFQTTWLVTLPLALPALIGGLILVFLEALALYGTPALIGIPARYNVVTTQLASFFEYPVRVEVASAFSMPLVVITAVMLGLQRLVLARRGYVTVAGKGGERRLVKLGGWRWLLFGWAGFVMLLAVGLPLLILIQTSFAKAWGQGFSLQNLTFENYWRIFVVEATARRSMWNTFVYSVATATACTGLGFAVAYVVQRRIIPYASVLALVTLAPFAVPGIVLAIAFYAAYAGPPLGLYGTGVIIVLAFTTRFLPIAFTTAAAGVRGLHPELEEAVRILGGTRLQALSAVVIPLLKKTLVGAWVLIFIISTRELSTAIFLSGPETRVVSVLTLDLSEQGRYEPLAAMGLVLLLVTAATVGVGMRILGRDFMLRRP